MYEVPTHSIICLLEVQYDRHQSKLGFPGFEAVENFLDNDLIFRDPPVWDECRLRWGDNFIEVWSKLSYQEL